MRVPNVLAVAGSDPSGGAGVQADLKSIMACGGYGMAAVTALTAQSTRGVAGVHLPPAAFVREQLDTLDADVRIDAVKTGMLATADVIRAVCDWLDERRPERAPLVVDPVMVASSGDRLVDPDAERAFAGLLDRADVVTPNLPELAVLLGEQTATAWDVALAQAARLAARHDVLVLAKGGHLPGPDSPDALVDAGGVRAEFPGPRIATRSTHGTGCSLSSALATLFAREGDWVCAAALARGWLRGALEAADRLEVGGTDGHGPLHHAHALWPRGGVPSRAAQLEAWWADLAPLRARIDDAWFVRQLADGTLAEEDFVHYVRQDAIYLRGYARVLSRAAQLAPTIEEQAFWAESSRSCLETELALHRSRGAAAAPPEASPETAAYLAHLAATAGAGDYGVLIAAALPCFWVYQDVGERLAAQHRPGHPYADWLAMYGSPAFAESTRRAIAWTQAAARAADDERLPRMRAAFEASCRHELAFFTQRAGVPRAGGAQG